MEQIVNDLSRLCSTPGVGGQPEIAACVQEMLAGVTDEVITDPMGSVIGLLKSDNEQAPVIMLEAHMDEIGFMVTHIDDGGFVHVTKSGGIDQRILTAQRVVVYGDKPYPGVFGTVDADGDKLPELEERGIDMGMTAEEAKARIPMGSRVSYAPCFREMQPGTVSSKALDNRAGVAAILYCLRLLKGKKLPVTVAAAICVQEEIGGRGSLPAAQNIQPDEAIITDVSFAQTPDVKPYECCKLNDGALVGISPILNDRMGKELIALAKEQNISYAVEVMGGDTGTDADSVSNALCGIPTALLSIPEKFMHTPIETLRTADVAAVGALMAAYIENKEAAR